MARPFGSPAIRSWERAHGEKLIDHILSRYAARINGELVLTSSLNRIAHDAGGRLPTLDSYLAHHGWRYRRRDVFLLEPIQPYRPTETMNAMGVPA